MQVSKVIRLHGYDIDYVAGKMGLSKASLAKSICASGNPSIGKIRQIAEIVGCDITEFFEDEVKNKHDHISAEQHIGSKIAAIMRERGLSVNEVAKKMGVLPQSLSRTINHGSCRVTTLKLVAEAIGCDIKDIMDEPKSTPVIICPYCEKEIEACISVHARNDE